MLLYIYLQSRNFTFLLLCAALFSFPIHGNSANAQSSQEVDDIVLFRVNAGGASIGEWGEDTDAVASP